MVTTPEVFGGSLADTEYSVPLLIKVNSKSSIVAAESRHGDKPKPKNPRLAIKRAKLLKLGRISLLEECIFYFGNEFQF